MLVNFTKMHGLGNDFMVIDNTKGDILLTKKQIQTLADRHFGIGFDQLLMVESSQEFDFGYRIFNANGFEVEQCGNGARCFARFVRKKSLSSANPLKVETQAGVIELSINADNSVTVAMGKPSFEPSKIGLLLEKSDNYQLEGFELGAVSMGNPHLVMIVDDINIDIKTTAIILQNSTKLKNSANIGFMQIVNQDEIRLRVYERGAGETLACGSGACAATAYGVKIGRLNARVVVHLSGGQVHVTHTKQGSILLSGPAEFVFEGRVNF